MHSNTHRQNIHISLFCAIICILSQISIPTPFGVPVTLQILAISLCGYILGYKNALKTVAVYILLGMLGLPVFANFKGGIPALLGPTGGFVAGFVFVAFFCGLNKKHKIIGIRHTNPKSQSKLNNSIKNAIGVTIAPIKSNI